MSKLMSNLKFPLETSRSISKIFTPLCLLALMGLAAFIRGYDLDRYYFTGDEALHLILAKIFDGNWISFCTGESHPPFYYILLKKYMEVFGVESRLGLRLISLISGVMTVGVGFLVGHRISASRCVGLLGAFLLVTAPPLIDQSQQLRGYALLILLLFVLVFLLIKREFSWLTLMTSLLVTGLACSTHYSAAVFVGATFLVGNLRIYESILNRKKIALIIWSVSHLCFFFGVYYLGSRFPVLMKDSHVGPLNAKGGQKIIETLFDISERFFLSTGSKIPWLFTVIIVIGIIVLVKTKRLPLLLVTIVPFCGAILLAQLQIYPLVADRWSIYLILPMWISVIVFLGAVAKKNKIFVLLFSVVFLFCQWTGYENIYYQKSNLRHPWGFYSITLAEMQMVAKDLLSATFPDKSILLSQEMFLSVEMETLLKPKWAVFVHEPEKILSCEKWGAIETDDKFCECIGHIKRMKPYIHKVYFLDYDNRYDLAKRKTGCIKVNSVLEREKYKILGMTF